MESIQIITNEWIDIIYLNNINRKITRKITNDNGTFYIDDDNALIINWEKWGEEKFIKMKNSTSYYNCKFEQFEIRLETNEWNDIGIFNVISNKIYRKYYPKEKGTFIFEDNDLIIKWDNWGEERFYQLNYGKIYTNTNFGNIIRNSKKKEIKMLAIVFPQFHEVEENNEFWGKGFTEWTLLKNIPRIVNGEIIKQPHNDIGYFNLNDVEHRKYMRILADKFNIYGFCYYHYWFKNKKVMYEPTELMLLDNEPNKPFLFCWANEQWTRKWDGGNNEILLQQEYTDIKGNIDHFNYLLQFFKHKNYIKKCNKPIFIFYRIEEKDINDINDIIKLWNLKAIENGFNGIHFMRFLGPFNNNINIDGIEGFVEFEPGYSAQKYFNELCTYDENKIFSTYDENIYLNKNKDVRDSVENNSISSGFEHYSSLSENERNVRTSKFFIYDGLKTYNKILDLERIHKEQHRGIFTGWNNTPRRNYINDQYDKYPHYYKNIVPREFGKIVKKLLNKIDNDPNNSKCSDEFIFISAWNEWNEQAILEPNNEDGYNNLIELNNAYLEYYDNPTKKNILFFCHNGGGTEKYVSDIKKIFNEYNHIDFSSFNDSIDYDMEYKNIDLIHINSILFNNLKDNYIYFFQTFFKNVKKYITVHDYQWLYPNEPNIIKDNFNSQKSDYKNMINFYMLLELCDKIIFPSQNIHDNYFWHFNYYWNINLNIFSKKIHIVTHMDKLTNNDFLVIPKITNYINIAFVGYFTEYKGASLLKKLANEKNYFNDCEIRYHIFGNIDSSCSIIGAFHKNNIIIHNSYTDNNIIDSLHKNNIHGILHLSMFDESYCYALTNSINSGIPIFYLNRGVFPERLSNKEKYISTDIENIFSNFDSFLLYIFKNQNISNYHNLNNIVQPNRWYLSEYFNE